MAKKEPRDTIDVATLPLEDGRKLLVPLQALVEVQQLEAGESPLGELHWRGYDLPVESLDALCGLTEPERASMASVAVLKAAADSGQPFRALAFCGIAGHSRIDAFALEPGEDPQEAGHFLGATRMGEEDYLIPNLPKLLFAAH